MNLAVNSTSSEFLRAQLDQLSLYLVPSDPTHHVVSEGQNSHTWLDIFVIRELESLVKYSKTSSPFIAGHDLIEITLRCHREKSSLKSFASRSLHNVDSAKLNSVIQDSLLPASHHRPQGSSSFLLLNSPGKELPGPSSSIPDVNGLLEATTLALSRAFGKLAPIKTVTVPLKQKPWVSPQIRALMRTRDEAYRKACRSSALSDHTRFKELRNMVSNDLDTAKNEYLASRLNSANTPDAKWKQLRSLQVTKPISTSPFSAFAPSLLNNFYASVVNQALPANFDTFNAIVNSHTSNSSFLPSETQAVHFDFSPISPCDVKRLVNSATSKGKGQDGITVKMLKLALPSTLIPLTKIINESLLSAIFPSEWKKTLIIPLAKSKIIKTPSDTRPIAQISELSKVPERVVHHQFSDYLESNKLLFSRQAGFRRGHSTTTALACVIDDIRQAIDRRMITILVLFDFSKAFDSIPHQRLLQKLHCFK